MAFGTGQHATTLGCLEALDLIPAELRVATVAAPPKQGSAAALRALRKLIASAAPDLVLTYNWGSIEAVLAARTLGLGVLHHEDGFLPDEARGFKRRRIWARRAVLRGTRGVVVPSHRLYAIATEIWKLPRALVRLIPNGVRLEAYGARDGNPSLRAELGIPAEAFLVGSVGHLRAEKNPARLVEALAEMRHPGARLLLLGDGPERGRVEALARERGVAARVHLAGHIADPRPYYRAMDAFALSSDTEQMPVALVEAMASSLPVASTNVGDVARMVPDAGRELVVDLDPAALARALDRLAEGPAERARLGAAGRERVERTYAFETMLAAYRTAYGQALRLR